jgi:hypothetical protein
VLVQIRHEAAAPIAAVYQPLQRRMFELWSEFEPGELRTISNFLSRSLDAAVQGAEEIRRSGQPAAFRRRQARTNREPIGTRSKEPEQ